jgi:hypothetical protein
MRKTVKNQSGIVVLLVHGMHIRIRRAKKFLFEYADIKPEGRTGVFGCNAIDFIWNPELDVGAHGVSEYDLGSWSNCYIKFVDESNVCQSISEVSLTWQYRNVVSVTLVLSLALPRCIEQGVNEGRRRFFRHGSQLHFRLIQNIKKERGGAQLRR